MKKHLVNWKTLLLVFCSILAGVRCIYTGHFFFVFMLWNLFLAFIPLWIAGWIEKETLKKPTIVHPIALLAWLLFLPNAPYMITDLIHIHPKNDAPMWFDGLLVFSFSFTGLLAGLLSMYKVHQYIRLRTGLKASWYLITWLSVCCGFGVYLGRVERWNSWDIIFRPVALIKNSFTALDNLQAINMTLAFGSMMFVCYVAFYQLMKKNNIYETHS